MVKINFKCSLCGNESWFKVHDDYVVSAKDLVCDECIPDDENVDYTIESKLIEVA